ncbi:hypothetical protein BS50DRAFT_552326 [Corynespora cassiicola Philippines]|uniref:Uncharacterized protein n=1 Tax=Corynespora cassiicola Philippines TaxID=1448308 RepID=A0A2T2NMN3_CORCC|nr:hypothetical protein BS50DRAFT_552326 [Corynespora cassiicola Philippines]
MSNRQLAVASLPVGEDGRPSIQRVLIANRGEIACRIIATCRKMNITTIAIYVDEDADSLHVQQADEAIGIGSIARSEGRNPFLDIDLIVETAVQTGAQAIHPGYGYLSENPDFVNAVRKAGIIFIGPSPVAMSTLGNKRSSKAYLSEHAPEVPLIPGFSGSSQNPSDLEKAAQSIGLPVMLKASSGGGGKGMRIVRESAQLSTELERAQSEAQRSFGDADIILEKYIEAGKHVEIQIVGDRYGKVVCLHERDCSVQRRHQKIIEETPCPWLTPDFRRRMGATAVRIAELIGYEGAGTVEFVVDVAAQKFYFLEVNARLQVEHPITEEVTGWDLVSLQLYVAGGGRFADIPSLQEIRQHGHAIECRLCAEDPQNDFLPERGTIDLWLPASANVAGFNPGDVRYETAVQTGSEVSIYFDSMIAKIVVWAPSRKLAIEKMARVLASSVCAGVRTNQLFMQSCLLHPDFRDPAYTTSFIPKNLEKLLENPYCKDVLGIQKLYGVIPALYLRQSSREHSLASRGAFRNTRLGFRNQRFDPINQHTNIVENAAVSKSSTKSTAPSEQPLLVEWLPQPPSTQSPKAASAHIRLSNAPPTSTPSEGPEDSVAKKVTTWYNTISTQIRNRHYGEKEATPSSTYNIALMSATLIATPTAPSSASNPALTLTVTINNAKVLAHIVCPDDNSRTPQNGSVRTVIAHFPSLGSWTAYKVYDLLSFAESLREEIAKDGALAGGAKMATAPMPCKILKVLKKDGEEVKAGETVMVVESMKMEMAISMAVGGKFKTGRKEGDAVDEGAVLCEVE